MNLFHPDTALILSITLSVFIPLLSAAIRWRKLPADLVGVLTLVISAINGFVTEWAESSDVNHYDWRTALGIMLYSLIFAVAAHYGFWKNTSITNNLLVLGTKKKAQTAPASPPPPGQHAA